MTDKTLIDRVRTALAPARSVSEKKMFGGTAFMVHGKMCITAREGRIMCRIDPAVHDAALESPGARTMRMGGREYRGYVVVDADAVRTQRALDGWIELALEFNTRAKASRRR